MPEQVARGPNENDCTATTMFESVLSKMGPPESPWHAPPWWAAPLLFEKNANASCAPGFSEFSLIWAFCRV